MHTCVLAADEAHCRLIRVHQCHLLRQLHLFTAAVRRR
eukprot:COSAG03_NODE_7437_length_918_cov_2.967033_1_plen_37_part_10